MSNRGAKPAAGARYPRDMVGYGGKPPDPRWPGKARLAVQFVINYEEGGENCVLHGDAASEAFLSEIVGGAAAPGVRHMSMESIYEYGSRAGFWRLLRLFTERRMPLTVFAVGMALERNPAAAAAMVEAGFEIASHGWRWIDYQICRSPHRARAYPPGGGGDRARDRQPAARLVHRAHQPQHALARRRAWRLPL